MHITICVDRMRCYGRHGVMEQERKVGNLFEVSLRLRYPADEAVAHDTLGDTLNYAEACEVVAEVMNTPSRLLENVCGRIREVLLQRWPAIEGGTIEVRKVSPPVGFPTEGVSVVIEW